MNWIELHTDTYCSEQLSFLDSTQIVSLCAKNGCTAVACTDRNSILSYLTMERAAEHKGIRLIYGVTLDCVDLDDRYAVTLLAKNESGRRNIFALMRLLEENRFPFGRCVTRQQIEEHREGLLVGASAVDGQLIRAIQLRRGMRRLKQIAAGYDYMEFPLEPYDTAVQLLQLSRDVSVPICAVQSARLDPNPSEAESHAFRAICYDAGTGDRPAPYLPPEKLAEQFRALYILPGERQELEQALCQGQKQIMDQIEPVKPLRHLLNDNAETMEQERQQCLRTQAEDALYRKYGVHPEKALTERFRWELEFVEQRNMAGQILLMQKITNAVHEAGGRVSIAGTWNSSFLLYLMDITELNPLPPELDSDGLDLCPVSLLGTKKPLLSADIHLPEECIPLVREKVTQQYGKQLLQIEHATIKPRSEAELQVLVEQYLDDCCTKETAELLREDGSFYYEVSRHSGRMQCDFSFTSIYLLPKTVDISALPVTQDSSEGVLKMVSSGSGRLDHIPCVLLLGSSTQSVLERYKKSTGIGLQQIPMDDESVYAALGEAYRSRDIGTPMAAACGLMGSSINQSNTELFDAMGFTDLHSLIRFMSLGHGSGLWEDNQKSLLQSGELCPAQLITCREDVYRYLLERGASSSEATEFMELVWRGKMGDADIVASQRKLLQKCGAEDWFLQVCMRIKYLFPESHSAEYAVSLVRLAWYVLHYPEVASVILDERSAYGDELVAFQP